MSAPSFDSLRRIVPQAALANGVRARPMRRSAHRSAKSLPTMALTHSLRHRRVSSRLVDEDDFVWIKRGLFPHPDLASQSHVGAPLLGRVKAFFEADPAQIKEWRTIAGKK
jgi:hypothetical protein